MANDPMTFDDAIAMESEGIDSHYWDEPDRYQEEPDGEEIVSDLLKSLQIAADKKKEENR